MIAATVVHHHSTLLGGLCVLAGLASLAGLPALFGILSGRRDGR